MLWVKIGLTALKIRVYSFHSRYMYQMLVSMAQSNPGGFSKDWRGLVSVCITSLRFVVPKQW